MNICLFTKEELCRPLPAKDERAEHIIKILHKKAGGAFTAGIIGGKSGIATITAIDSGGVHYTFTATGEGKPLLPLVLVVGFPRPIQLRRLLRDAASLGVCQVHLTATALGDKSYMKSTLLQKGTADRMLLEGAAQAGSTHAPALFMHRRLDECLNAVAGQKGTVRIALDNVRPVMPLAKYLKSFPPSTLPAAQYTAAIGAERGWTDDERELFTRSGWTLCSMGSRILRTETAAACAASIILAETGLMGDD